MIKKKLTGNTYQDRGRSKYVPKSLTKAQLRLIKQHAEWAEVEPVDVIERVLNWRVSIREIKNWILWKKYSND